VRGKMEKWMLQIQHIFNPLHIYCRLVDVGLKREVAIAISKYYELLIYSWFSRLTVTGVAIARFARR